MSTPPRRGAPDSAPPPRSRSGRPEWPADPDTDAGWAREGWRGAGQLPSAGTGWDSPVPRQAPPAGGFRDVGARDTWHPWEEPEAGRHSDTDGRGTWATRQPGVDGTGRWTGTDGRGRRAGYPTDGRTDTDGRGRHAGPDDDRPTIGGLAPAPDTGWRRPTGDHDPRPAPGRRRRAEPDLGYPRPDTDPRADPAPRALRPDTDGRDMRPSTDGRGFPATGDLWAPPPDTGGRGRRPDPVSRSARLDTDGRGLRPDTDGRGQRFDTDGRGQRFDTDGRGRRPDTDGRGTRFDTDGRGRRFDTDGRGRRADPDGLGRRASTDGRGRRADTDGRGRPAGPGVRPPGPPGRAMRPETRSQTQELARLRRRRHRMVGVLAGGLILVLLVGLAWVVRGWLRTDPGDASLATGLAAGLDSAAPSGSAAPGGSAPPSGAQPSGSADVGPDVAAANANVPDKGAGTFAFSTGTGNKLGSAGTLRHYRVAVENGAKLDPNAFAAQVDAILGDPKGWTAGGKVTFQRVPQGSSYDVTIYLATPATTDQMCATGGLHVQKYLSCRLPGQIVINLGRWQNAVPDYGAPLDTYRQFALNHEVGRDLGYANEACPGADQLAPVMQQQSLGLDGCVPNAWPYPRGSLYQGRPVP